MLNIAYRMVAVFSILTAFCVGALLHSGIQHAKHQEMMRIIAEQPVQSLTMISTRDL